MAARRRTKTSVRSILSRPHEKQPREQILSWEKSKDQE